jgi:hypothetical protein
VHGSACSRSLSLALPLSAPPPPDPQIGSSSPPEHPRPHSPLSAAIMEGNLQPRKVHMFHGRFDPAIPTPALLSLLDLSPPSPRPQIAPSAKSQAGAAANRRKSQRWRGQPRNLHRNPTSVFLLPSIAAPARAFLWFGLVRAPLLPLSPPSALSSLLPPRPLLQRNFSTSSHTVITPKIPPVGP